MVNDPIADFIIRIKNASMAGKERVSAPYSAFVHAVAEALMRAGFLSAVEKQGKKERKMLSVVVSKDAGGRPRVQEVKRISKPGRRLYRGVSEIHRVRYGQGALILSTPKGVLTDTEARKENVGGEALFEIH